MSIVCLSFIAALMLSIDEVRCLYSCLHFECYLEMTQQNLKNNLCTWQGNSSESKMSKHQKKKAPMVEEEPEVEIVTRVKYTYEDTKCIVGVEPKYQWVGIYILITRLEVPNIGFEE